MKLGNDKPRKVTEPDFRKKFTGSRFWGKRGQKWSFLTFVKNLAYDLVYECGLNERPYEP